ncbi:MAG: AAA family ATPase, partial [Solirubrobacteraceae bacterium]|nr:AAA family ATPase [Solirubrobacteraceae bacterium]
MPSAYALLDDGASLVLVHEDIGGASLDTLLAGEPCGLAHFFRIALALVEALEVVHAQRIVHRDIKPHNIIVNAETGQVQLIDFGLASQIVRERAEMRPPEQLEGTLSYLAPEQTGRMNRAVDYRADFYALGVTLYELLTGRLPFVARDALELLHCHLARMPRPPQELAPSCPAPLGAIVMKLLAKLAEDRYQSAAGLRADLAECERQWATTGRVAPFELGAEDRSDRFQLPQRLFGREAEIRALLDAFERVASAGRPELVLVAGYSGVGKSALVAELHGPIVGRRGHFIAGKFDQYRRGVPYATLAQAFGTLAQHLLAESPAALRAWRARILEAVGAHGRIVTELVPQMERVIGVQPELTALAPDQARHRLHRVFQRFVGLFTRAAHPLVLFIDDLQWIVAASLQLLT